MLEKEKADEKFQKWLAEVNEKKRLEAQRKKEEEEKTKLNVERIKLKRAEKNKLLTETNKKKSVGVRANVAKKAEAIINGKLHSYFDWSTSPAPSYVNEQPWQS